MRPTTHSISRRALLRGGAAAGAGLLLGDRLPLAAAAPPGPEPRARAVIQVWLWGGPSHLDTFDPKPAAGADYCGPFTRPVAGEGGLQLGELLPLLAAQARRFSLVRSLTHGSNGHETAAYTVQTGRPAGGRDVFPGAGAVVACLAPRPSAEATLIPPYVVLTEPQGRFSEAGFLGARLRPFATGGDPARAEFHVEGITSAGVSRERQRSRRALLGELDALRRARPDHPALQELARCEEQAYDLILGDAGKVFDLALEADAVRERYGRTTFGQSCLAARRLVEQGVRYVTINFKGWDTHKQHFQAMRRLLPDLDRGLSALLEDLDQRGLLARTVVWCGGEFGRTPRVQWEAPWNGGRGHHGQVFSALLAGGGFQGGRVVGASDARGVEVAARPVSPRDLLGSIYRQLGIPADARLPHPTGEHAPVLPAPQEGPATGGLLEELL